MEVIRRNNDTVLESFFTMAKIDWQFTESIQQSQSPRTNIRFMTKINNNVRLQDYVV